MSEPTARKSSREGRVSLGKIVGAFGIRGECRFSQENTESDFLFAKVRTVWLVSPSGDEREVRVRARSGAGNRVAISLEGVVDRDAAEALFGSTLEVEAKRLPPPEAGSWYIKDLLGKPVSTDAGRDLGEIVEIHQTASVDVWEIRGPEGTFYLPVLKERVLEVGERVIVADSGVLGDDPTP